MIWVRGQLVPDTELKVSVLDRTFQHGLGLFETFRTWDGQPSLLSRHLARITRSARELDLPLYRAELPDTQSVFDLIAADRDLLVPDQDVRLRLTLSGGLSSPPSSVSLLWIIAQALPPPVRESGVVITQTMQVTADDPLSRHKTLNYWRKRIAQAQACEVDSDDVICVTPDGYICETCRANIFLIARQRLLTPSLDGPLLPGVMRGVVLERARQMGLEVEEAPLPVGCIGAADEAFLTNSVRGILAIGRLMDRVLPVPGPITRQLWNDVRRWLELGGPKS